ncbi:hypothetical protein PASE110613_06805 [Paenibacillus sediminis]|uniref:Uncharacterized protein n=1 Tax=Paenibacillus sediminis TaxID=664909 RepID=A0ABS4H1T6_9BACL|nr:hypothetical protein [Paenibacillus sediminis]MBP1936493.1 hypothetical protein [Paenibacillus sediminis]
MRTENQVKSKINELTMQKKMLENRIATTPQEQSAAAASLQMQIARLEDMIIMLEWVLNEPTGKYHA